MMKNRQDSFVTQIFFLPLSGMPVTMAFSTVFRDFLTVGKDVLRYKFGQPGGFLRLSLRKTRR